MYIDYEILNTLRQNNMAMKGTDLLNAVFHTENPVFSQNVLKALIQEGLVKGDIHSTVSLTPKGAITCLELEAVRQQQEDQKQRDARQQAQFQKSHSLALFCAFVSTTAAIASILIGIFK